MSPDKSDVKDEATNTLAELLFRLSTPDLRNTLERFRVKYEASHGPTDLTRRYTSMWETKDQEFMLNNFPKEYFDGLPPFVKAFYREQLGQRAKEGRLDDAHPKFIELFVRGQMHGGNGRER